MWPLDPLPPPPIPQRLREMLKDYPQLLQELQDSLDKVITDPVRGIPSFEVAIWALEDTLGSFVSEARKELRGTKVGGDSAAIENAEKKLDILLGTVFKGKWLGDTAFNDYFQDNARAPK